MIGGFPPPYGGVSIWNKRVLDYFIENDIEFAVIPWYGYLPKEASQFPFEGDRRVKRAIKLASTMISDPFLLFATLRFVPLCLRNLYSVLTTLAQARQVARKLREKGWTAEKCLIYSSYCPTFRGLFAVYLKSLLGNSTLVMHIHGAEVIECLQDYKKLMTYVLVQADKILVASEYMKSRTCALGIPGRIVTVIPSGVTIDYEERKCSKENLVMFCGRLDHSKDPLTLLRAARRVVHGSGSAIKFLFIGEGILRERMDKFIRKENLQNYVKLLGQLPNDRLVAYYKKARIFVLPSIREPFGLVLTEAISHYVPCIITDIGGMPEIITHGREGFIVPKGDHDKIAEYILKLFSNDELYDKMSQNARKKSQQYDINTIVGKLLKLLSD